MDKMLSLHSPHATLAQLPSYDFRVSPATTVESVAHRLEAEPDLPGVLIIDDRQLVGMLSRQKCFEVLSWPYGTELFLKKPLSNFFKLIEFSPTILPWDTTIERSVQIALNRPLKQLYEPIVVQFCPGEYKLIDLHVVLLAQSQMLAQANNLVQRQIEIGRSLTGTLELEEVMNTILDGVATIVPYDRAGIILRNGETFQSSSSGASLVCEQPWVSNSSLDSYGDLPEAGLLYAPSHSWDREALALLPGTNGWVGIPLVHAEEMIGVLALAPKEPTIYGTEQHEFIQVFAAQAAIALQNARLFSEVQRLAVADPLTGLYNRRSFFELATAKLGEAARSGQPLSMIMIDVDHFKEINDLYGHLSGDKVLQSIAQVCRDNLRKEDIIGRYGGEEFMILIAGTTAAKAQQVAERLCQRIARTSISTNKGIFTVTVSAGISRVDVFDDTTTLELLIEHADEALYLSKTSGRNRVTTWKELDIQTYNLPISDRGGLVFSHSLAGRNPFQITEDQTIRLLTTTLQASNDGVLIADKLGTILWVNRAFTGMSGYETHEVLGQKIYAFSSGKQNAAFYQAMWEAVASGQVWRGKMVSARKDNSLYLEEQTIHPFFTAGNEISHFIVVKRDISDNERIKEDFQRRTNELERQLVEMEAVNRISTAMRAAQNLEEMLPSLLDETLAVLDSTAGAIWLYDPETNLLCPSALQGWFADLPALRLKPGQGIVGKVFETSQTQCSLELIKDTQMSLEERNATLPGWGGACVPIRTATENVGVLFLSVELPRELSQQEIRLLTTLAEIAGNAIHRMRLSDKTARLLENLEQAHAELAQAYDQTLASWDKMLELRDQETEGHSQRVVEMTVNLAQAMGVAAEELVHIRRGALLHDIGKMGIPDNILLKPAPLTEEEWEVMKKHPVYVYEMLSSVPFLQKALEIPYCHHEKWNGKGYPRRLAGKEIPLAARIFAVIDVWDALRSNRPYRQAWSEEQALDYILAESGKQFDPHVIEAFCEFMEKERRAPVTRKKRFL